MLKWHRLRGKWRSSTWYTPSGTRGGAAGGRPRPGPGRGVDPGCSTAPRQGRPGLLAGHPLRLGPPKAYPTRTPPPRRSPPARPAAAPPPPPSRAPGGPRRKTRRTPRSPRRSAPGRSCRSSPAPPARALCPAATHTACRFSRQRRACSAALAPTSSPLAGSSGICPEQNSSSAARPHRVAVGPDRRRRPRGGHGLASAVHTSQTLHPRMPSGCRTPSVTRAGSRA